MISSLFASKLECRLCGKNHMATEWPEHGDHMAFNFQDEPGHFYVSVYCPYTGKNWFVVWDQNPGSIMPTGLKVESPDSVKRESFMEKTELRPLVIFKFRVIFDDTEDFGKVRKPDLRRFPEGGFNLGVFCYSKDETSCLSGASHYTDEAYERAKKYFEEVSLEEYARIRTDYLWDDEQLSERPNSIW
jgi:hypothetical protein